MPISETNAKGVLLLSQERFEDAARTFRAGLSDLHSLLLQNPPLVGCDMSQEKPIRNLSGHYQVAPTDIVTTASANDCSSFLLYSKAFFVVPSMAAATERQAIDEHLISAVFLYNLGLSFHLRGHAFAKSRSTDHQRALYLYNMALKFFPALLDRQGDTSTLLQLAIWNNMARIHLEHYDFEAFETRISWMDEQLQESLGNERDYGFFVLNLAVLDPSTCFCLAAAA